MAMRSSIVRIGNSQGVRIPKLLLDETGLSGEVEIRAENGTLLIGRARQPREGWDQAFQQMASRGDDLLLDAASPSLSKWDRDQWQWQ
jgi:antitoxin MazE